MSTPQRPDTPLRYRSLPHSVCDICGKRRGGFRPINHDKCAKLRRQRGEWR